MRSGILVTLALAALLIAGCAQPNLSPGEYRIDLPGRDDFAVVYEDLIFIHVKTPESIPDPFAYWEWAGKYRVLDNGAIDFDMDRETRRRWNFSYQFMRKKEGIGFNDWERRVGFVLRYRQPEMRRSARMPRPVGGAGADPTRNYQDLSGAGR